MKFVPLTTGILMAIALATMSLAQGRVIVAPDNNSFAKQTFSSALLKKIPQGNKACQAYQGKPNCSYQKRHIFKDVVLINEGNVPSDDTLTIIPTQPISKDQALGYAKILSGTKGINYAAPASQTSNQIIYKGCQVQGFDLCNTVLNLNSIGKVVSIKHGQGSL
jgi:hypothetical protein